MSKDLYVMFKSLVLVLTLFIITLLSLVPALAFHFSVLWLIGETSYHGFFNIITLAILCVCCYCVTKPGAFTYKVLRYIENY